MTDRWFCSDHHLGHTNIITYSGRPFKDVKEMGECLIEWHNAYVKPQDHVSFLGDVTLRRGNRTEQEWLIREIKRYHGHKRLYLGNHDHFPIKVYLEAGFEKIYATWRDQSGIVCSHIPIHPQSMGSASANVHGHIHANKDYPPLVFEDDQGKRIIRPYINVCLEMTGYRPLHLDEVLERIKKIKGGG